MIVVGLVAPPESSRVTAIARRAATAGAKVEVVGIVPGDAAWDKVLFELTSAGVGHATVVRSARGSMEPADLDLALRYLPDVGCVVLVEPPARLLPAAIGGSDFAGAPLVLIGPLDPDAMALLDAPGAESRAFVLEPPARDPDGTFAGFVAALVTRLDAGDPPEVAMRTTVSDLAADPA